MPSLKRRRSEEAWVVVANATGLAEAEILAGVLKTANIPYYVKQESVGRVLGIHLGALGMVELLVPARYAQEAIALLDTPTLDDLPPGLEGPTIDFGA